MNGRIVIVALCFSAFSIVGCSGSSGDDTGHEQDVIGDAVIDNGGPVDATGSDESGDIPGHDTAVGDPGTDESVNDANGTDGTVDDAAETETTEPVFVTLNPRASGCGGFDVIEQAFDDRAGELPECTDETLDWEVDSQNGVIHFVNSGAWLNCCGEHSIEAYIQDGVYVIREEDSPDGENGRCRCMCLFEFAVDVPLVEGTIAVRLERYVTENGETPETTWSGDIDLAGGTGQIVIREDVGWCGAEATNIGLNPAYSACGGFEALRLIPLPAGEYLDWVWDEPSGKLSLTNRSICLNCCGEHSMSVYLQDGIYVVHEKDSPDGLDGRCFCNCRFDFAMDVPSVAAGVIGIVVLREVTDANGIPETVWQGTIDLSGLSGSIAIDNEPAECI